MRQITVSNIKIDVIKKDIENLHLAVYPPTGRVRIAAPLNVGDEAIRLFAVSKLKWIKKHRQSFDDQNRQTKREYVSGESHYFEGRRYLLNVTHRNAKPEVEIRNKTHIELCVRENSTPQQREKVLNEWYRKKLEARIASLIAEWQTKINVEANDWQIKRMRTKWGTCKIDAKRIWLNLELAKKPLRCLEYIIVHELVHLLERHHNERFVCLMDKFLSNWRFLQSELNEFILGYDDWNECEAKE